MIAPWQLGRIKQPSRVLRHLAAASRGRELKQLRLTHCPLDSIAPWQRGRKLRTSRLCLDVASPRLRGGLKPFPAATSVVSIALW